MIGHVDVDWSVVAYWFAQLNKENLFLSTMMLVTKGLTVGLSSIFIYGN